MVGAVTIVGLENLLADKVGSWVTVIMGAMFVVCVLAFRRGIVGEIRGLLRGQVALSRNPASRLGRGGFFIMLAGRSRWRRDQAAGWSGSRQASTTCSSLSRAKPMTKFHAIESKSRRSVWTRRT